MSERNVKKRNWAFILYPESAVSDWRDILQSTGLQCAISPLHDMDVNPTGELKKAHYHVIVCYAGPTSYSVVKGLCDRLGCPIPQPLEQIKGYYRYFTHKDNPEKYQYDEADIVSINGFNIFDFVDLTRREIDEIKLSICEIIRSQCIQEYADLIDYLLDTGMMVEFSVASSNTLFFDRYISSGRYKMQEVDRKG